MKIIIADNGVYVERARRCFIITKSNREKFLIEGDASLAVILGIREAAVPGVLKKKKHRTTKVRLATIGEVTDHVGHAVPVKDETMDRTYATQRARPCKVTWRVNGKRQVTYLRSMSATRRAWGLDVSSFEKIVGKLPGWKRLLPMYLEEIKVVARIPANHEEVDVGAFDTNGLKVSMKGSGKNGVVVQLDKCQKRYPSPVHVPPQIRELVEMSETVH